MRMRTVGASGCSVKTCKDTGEVRRGEGGYERVPRRVGGVGPCMSGCLEAGKF